MSPVDKVNTGLFIDPAILKSPPALHLAVASPMIKQLKHVVSLYVAIGVKIFTDRPFQEYSLNNTSAQSAGK